jgi:tRNA A-37 threonylcarbamoyl transferase component Bud32/outer membrane biosynthesis protein TonB
MNERDRRNYQVLNTIATGGTAVLYKAIQTSLDRPVVIKRLHAHLIADPNFTRRFQLEAKAAASLDHENIVRIIDFGSANDNYYIVMEYIDGSSLKEILETRRVLGEELTLLIAREICMGLDHAHQHGIIHRDIKPANIMITNEGQVKITDFGLAKLHQSQTQQTVSATLLGTPLYMSPEQAIGDSIDGRSDLFSLGTICYEAMTGTQPFRGDNYAAVIQSIITGNIPPPSRIKTEISSDAETLVMKALAREPGKRFRTAGEMARAIEGHLGQDTILSIRERLKRLVTGVGEAGDRGAVAPLHARRRRRKALPATLAVVSSVGVIIAFGLLFGRSTGLGTWLDAIRRPHPTAPSGNVLIAGHGEAAPGMSMTPLEEAAPAALDTNASPPVAPTVQESGDASQSVDSTVTEPERTTPPTPSEQEAVRQPGGETPPEPAPEKPLPEEQPVRQEAQPAIRETPPAEPPPARQSASETSRGTQPEAIGYVRISVDPPSEIIIDGRTRAVGDQITMLELPAGAHEVVCRHEGYRDYAETITIKRGELSRRSVILEAVTGGIMIETLPGAQVIVDGVLKGITPLTAPLEIPAGTHEVELRKVGCQPWKSGVYVPPNETLRLNIGLVSL